MIQSLLKLMMSSLGLSWLKIFMQDTVLEPGRATSFSVAGCRFDSKFVHFDCLKNIHRIIWINHSFINFLHGFSLFMSKSCHKRLVVSLCKLEITWIGWIIVVKMIFTACKRRYSSFKFNWIQARNELVVSIVALQDTTTGSKQKLCFAKVGERSNEPAAMSYRRSHGREMVA